MFISLWEFFYGHFFRFWMKWLLRQMTGKCELQRIFDTYVGAQRTHRIENSLTYSKNKKLLIVRWRACKENRQQMGKY
uniref:ELMO domain containing 2 n=1 Tax=Macaca fascicularis TaxID=9541 RepID=A0A7N9CPY6_MACFA